jgi:hypothetical protein
MNETLPPVWVIVKDGKILATNDEPCLLDGIVGVRYAPAEQVLCEASRAQVIHDLLHVIEHLRAWIKAVPDDTPLPAMPGLDGDYIESTVNYAQSVEWTK